MKNTFYALLSIFFLFSTLINAQEDTTNATKEKNCKHDKEYYDYEFEFDFDFISKKNQPAISLNYGYTELSRKDLLKNPVNPLSFELKLGTIKQKNIFEKDDLIKEDFRYLIIGNQTSYLNKNNTNAHKINSDTWEIGFGKQRSYGYRLSESFSILPYTESSFKWSRINFAYDSASVPLTDQKILNMFDESFRFGNSSAGGIKFQLVNNLAIDVAYQRQIVYQRVLFWKWAVSTILESASHGLLDNFINKIFSSSPYAAPIVSFVLKNALSYGIYELRQEKMNYPFNSEPPLSFDQFKIGITFIF